MNIRLHIERLVLDGLRVNASDGALLKASLEAELGRLLSESGINSEIAAGGALPRLEAAPMQVRRGATPAQIGSGIAHSVFSGVGKQ
ncbi:hypothetical protein FXV83_26860 [Bradyrhizobium hipponense]|uniref:Uncharacterized protein n=1 Tax=Bradyrhizobium hipponense TaxID=2605638 RepID=A0A5S4YT96_9BRAD|nr:hypothetical protein [Bradyrhizobium hipponense]TYO63529.1 hypothetical protein FXV83_26860 [Bradyrhizobium hipponense]